MQNKKQWIQAIITIVIGGGLITHFNPGNFMVMFNYLNH